MGESVHVQQEQIDLLNSLGYELIAKNVANENNPFEDWWVDPTVVDAERVKFYKEKTLLMIVLKNVQKLFLMM